MEADRDDSDKLGGKLIQFPDRKGTRAVLNVQSAPVEDVDPDLTISGLEAIISRKFGQEFSALDFLMQSFENEELSSDKVLTLVLEFLQKFLENNSQKFGVIVASFADLRKVALVSAEFERLYAVVEKLYDEVLKFADMTQEEIMKGGHTRLNDLRAEFVKEFMALLNFMTAIISRLVFGRQHPAILIREIRGGVSTKLKSV